MEEELKARIKELEEKLESSEEEISELEEKLESSEEEISELEEKLESSEEEISELESSVNDLESEVETLKEKKESSVQALATSSVTSNETYYILQEIEYWYNMMNETQKNRLKDIIS